jgi:hypothetical protein
MTDVMVYEPEYERITWTEGARRWHSNHRVFGDLLPGDRLWVITSGKRVGLENDSAGHLVAVWPVAQVVQNPDDDPLYPARKYQYRVLANETEALHLDEPVCVDHIIRGAGYDARIPVGRFLRGPRRLSDEKVRQLRSAAGAEIAQTWLTASKPGNGHGSVAAETSPRERQTQ